MVEKILLIDDEPGLLQMVNTLLMKEGFKNVFTAETGGEAIKLIKEIKIDLIVLDVMLPDMDGFELCKRIREETTAPIIFLTARTSDLDKVTGLIIGGDDYLEKPFNPMELVARVKAHLRRQSFFNANAARKNEVYDFGRFSLNVNEGEVIVDGKKIKCPLKEFELLEFFCKYPNQVFSVSALYERVWGESCIGNERTVMVHISRLREKIERNPQQPEFIINVRGFGYKLIST
ncbi:response regulator transcription factor [Bacillus sp. FJAT-49705]|uniref:Response regulator transcription factor n=1 Tax=Cytobacillus citreus TaxID=2833586 RepID=A0ABS5NZ70_9BACI|nr:response regulator transcription factor [Cytobacillus citreus]MBS4193137.1 response regulator transcription factor [Cytobacillus citreus]